MWSLPPAPARRRWTVTHLGAVLLVAGLAFAAGGTAAAAPVRVPPPAITAPADGSTVTTSTPQLSGTGAPGDSVIVNEAGFIRCVATVGADRRWACRSASSLNNGVHHLTATQTDHRGTMSGNSATLNLTVRSRAGATGSTPPKSTPRTAVTAPPGSAATVTGEKASPKSGGGQDRNVPLAIVAVLAFAAVVAGAAFLRLRPRR